MKQTILVKKMAFFFMLAMVLGVRLGFAIDCNMLSDDFSNIFSFTSTYQTKNADWSVSNGSLYCTNIVQGKSAVAKRSFDPTGPFSADIDIDMASSDSSSYVGLYIYTDGDVFFETDGITVDGIEVIIFPQGGKMYFYVWDVVNGEWKHKGPYSISGQLGSFGLAFTENKVVFRQDGQDTDIELTGTFTGFDNILDRLWIEAGGENTSVYFDDLCISSYSPSATGPINISTVTGEGAGLSLPTTKTSYPVMPAEKPVMQGAKDELVPFGLGSAASGGTTLDLEVALPGYQAPVDIYLGVNISTYPDVFFLFNQSNEVVSLDQAFTPWRAGVSSAVDEVILKGVPVSLLGPNVRLSFFLLVLPSGTTSFNAYDLWVTAINLGTGEETSATGSASPSSSNNGGGGRETTPSGSGLKGEVTTVMDQIMSFLPAAIGLYDDLSGILDGDSTSDIITITPSDIDLFNLPTNMTVDIDFGSGYRLKDGSVMTGSGRLSLSNIHFNASSLGADFSFTAHAIKKDGQDLLDGTMSGTASLSGSGDDNTLNGNITFSGLKLNGEEVRGGLVITGHNIDMGEGTFQEVAVQPTGLQYGGVSISSGSITVSRPSASTTTIVADLDTTMGPVSLTMSVAGSGASGYEWNTLSQGQLMGYGVSVQGLLYDSSVCEDYPIGGSITLTKGSESGRVSFTNSCDGTYSYSE